MEQHVALADQYPCLKRPGWVMHQVLHAGGLLNVMPEVDRPRVAARRVMGCR